MSKKMFTYRETITFEVSVSAEDKAEAKAIGSDYIEDVLDAMEAKVSSNDGVRGYELQTDLIETTEE